MQNRDKRDKFLTDRLLQEELNLHPDSGLLDIFKIFYQSAFGPGHIILDMNNAKKCLKDELENVQKYEKNQYQNISWKNDYYRVNLSVITEGIVSFDDYFTAFINSTVPKYELSWDNWKLIWKQIYEEIKKVNYDFFKQEEDETRINEILDKKILAFSHSKKYKELYDPHYRLISKKEIEKMGLKFL